MDYVTEDNTFIRMYLIVLYGNEHFIISGERCRSLQYCNTRSTKSSSKLQILYPRLKFSSISKRLCEPWWDIKPTSEQILHFDLSHKGQEAITFLVNNVHGVFCCGKYLQKYVCIHTILLLKRNILFIYIWHNIFLGK